MTSVNLQDLKKMTAFDADDPSNDSKRYIAYNAITNMMYYAKELTQNYNDYENTDRNSRNSIVLFSAIRDNLNNYVQTFMDCVIVLCDCPSTTLRGLVTSFLSTYNLSNDLECWVQFLVRRNDLIHDYLSYDFLNEELYNALVNYNKCVIELAQFIQKELQRNNLMEVKIRKL